MRDVLDTLRRLPASCAAVMNDEVVIIRRGAREPASAPHITPAAVAVYNQMNGVTPEQQQCMIAGVTLGWDADAACPPENPSTWDFIATVAVQFQVQASSEAEAVEIANFITNGDGFIISGHPWNIESLDLVS